VRKPLSWEHGAPPPILLARPEGWMADYSRHDSLVPLLGRGQPPIAITSLGLVPQDLPAPARAGIDGWRIKQKCVARALAFWLHQGAEFVLLHSAYEGKQDVMSHALIPYLPDPASFDWRSAPPLAIVAAFQAALRPAQPDTTPRALRMRFALEPDPVLIPDRGAGPLRASDAVALLPFQTGNNRFAIAAYVLTPDITQDLGPLALSLRIDAHTTSATAQRLLTGDTTTLDVEHDNGESLLHADLYDDLTWIVLETK
jgi:hypothetical protein